MTTSSEMSSRPAGEASWLDKRLASRPTEDESTSIDGVVPQAALSALVVVVARLWTSWGRTEYAIWPDEPAQLAMARLIGGGTRWNMHNHSTWRPGFATLLAPVHLFTDDPVTVLRSALVLNALLGGVAAWLLVLLARRLTTMSPWMCAAAAMLISLSPSVVFTTDFVWSEALVVPLYLALLLVLIRFDESPTLGAGIVAGLLAAAAFGTHSRMLPLAGITVGLVILAARRRDLSRRDAGAIIAVTTAVMMAVSLYSRWVVGELWDEPSNRNSIGGVVGQLWHPGSILLSLSGQTWYLLVSTLGIVAYGVVELARSAGQRGPQRSAPRLVLVTVVCCLALSVVFMADRWRPDQLLYGRYNDSVIGPVLLVGIGALIGSIPARRAATTCASAVAVTIGTASVLWLFRRDLLASDNGLEPMILGIQAYVRAPSSIPLLAITSTAAVTMVALAVIAVVAARRQLAAVTVLAISALIVVGYVRTRTVIDRDWGDWGDEQAVEDLRDGPLSDGVPVDFYVPDGSNSTGRMMIFQMYLPRTEFTVVSNPAAGDAGSLVFAPTDDPALALSDARTVWTDRTRRLSLWQR